MSRPALPGYFWWGRLARSSVALDWESMGARSFGLGAAALRKWDDTEVIPPVFWIGVAAPLVCVAFYGSFFNGWEKWLTDQSHRNTFQIVFPPSTLLYPHHDLAFDSACAWSNRHGQRDSASRRRGEPWLEWGDYAVKRRIRVPPNFLSTRSSTGSGTGSTKLNPTKAP
jgi:hypothetical protein